MPLGQSIIAGFIASEVIGYIAEQCNVSNQNVRITKCVVAAGVGTIVATATSDTLGIIGVMALGAAYLGGYDPLYIVAGAFKSVTSGVSNKMG